MQAEIMHAINNEQGFIRVILSGRLDQQSLVDAQKELMLHPEYPFKNSLWIFEEDFECHFSNDGMIDLIKQIKTYFPIGATKDKAALCAKSNTHYAIMQLFCEEADGENLPFEIRAFQNCRQAEAWLSKSNSAHAL
jgi:hypothetical protein